MGSIVEIQFNRLTKLLDDRKIKLHPDAKARDWLADRGYDPAYGARPLKRVMQKELQDALAEKILAGDILDGATVTVSADDKGLIIDGKQSKSTQGAERLLHQKAAGAA